MKIASTGSSLFLLARGYCCCSVHRNLSSTLGSAAPVLRFTKLPKPIELRQHRRIAMQTAEATPSTKKIALVQTNSTSDFQRNLEFAVKAAGEAADNGASLIAFPENFLFLGTTPEAAGQHFPLLDDDSNPLIQKFCEIAKERNVVILLGSVPEKIPLDQTETTSEDGSSSPRKSKIHNTSILINQKGDIVKRYRKVHLFDLSLPNLQLLESKNVDPGKELVVVPIELSDPVVNQGSEIKEPSPPMKLNIGLTVCYDLRFPNQFLKLRDQGAHGIFVPSAFTVPTGEAHWMTLLRARAIETQCYIWAPAQVGKHNEKRESYGKSVAIDPWGTVQSVAPDEATIIYSTIDLAHIDKVRTQMPVFSHRVARIDY
eukprot:TRINITY_DN2012_c0_g1_i1.p1 TRINITY_DN2012_c0_g1~~TRINITY_DN2012_c0_g1_i1.p1  ORF type:complete len:372 (-),score=80.45 TRINITY_DN2012_c0_g1_i1:47-1162(-)